MKSLPFASPWDVGDQFTIHTRLLARVETIVGEHSVHQPKSPIAYNPQARTRDGGIQRRIAERPLDAIEQFGRSQFDAVIIAHSVEPELRNKLSKRLRELQPKVPIAFVRPEPKRSRSRT
jgi:hypothetical protein